MSAQPVLIAPPASGETAFGASGLLSAVEHIVAREPAPQVVAIDRQGVYPEAVIRMLGAARVFSRHLPSRTDDGIIIYCFKGARAANTFVALTLAGFKRLRI